MKIAIGIFFCVLSFSFYSQDTTNTKNDTIKKHSVGKAMLFSAVLPGAGQVYNHLAMPKGQKKAYWKVPLIYAGLGVTSYFLIKNHQRQLSFKNEYKSRMSGNAPGDAFIQYDDQGLLTAYQTYSAKRDRFILGVGIVYLLQVADAGIEAHFVNFDISPDLSMQIRPTLLGYSTPGVGIKLNFK